MSGSIGKDVENAANSVIEALVRKMFEVQDRLRQKESELIKLHESTVNEIEKNIINNNQKQNFSLENENGVFKMKSLENNQLIFENNEKQVPVNLNEVESVAKPIELEKAVQENRPITMIDIQEAAKENPYIKEYQGKSNAEIAEIIKNKEEEAHSASYSASYCENSEQKSREYKEVELMYEQLDKMRSAKEILQNYKDQEKDTPENQNNQKTNQETSVKNPLENQNTNSNQNVQERFKDQAKSINNQFNKDLEENVQTSLDNNKSALLISSQIRGQMEAVNLLKSLSEKEIINNFKVAQKQAKTEGRPLAEVYKENLQILVNREVQISKEKTLDVAINTYEKNQGLRENLRGIEKEINKNVGILYQAKLEQKIPSGEYMKMKENLENQKSQIQDKLLKIDANEQKINEQLKVDLKQQFPEMKTDNLKINESVGLATAAYTMTNENTIENLRNFSLENDLKGVIHSIDKTTKEIEIEITEITETISR